MEFETKHFFNNTEVDIDKVVDYIMQHPQDTRVWRQERVWKNDVWTQNSRTLCRIYERVKWWWAI